MRGAKVLYGKPNAITNFYLIRVEVGMSQNIQIGEIKHEMMCHSGVEIPI
jgi:hypothetical protein